MRPSVKDEARWGNARRVREVYGLSRRQLKALCDAGLVRTAKLGDSRTSQRLFFLKDVERCLRALAEGRKPRRYVTWDGTFELVPQSLVEALSDHTDNDV